MFDQLSEKVLSSFKKIRGQTKISESNIEDAIKDIRMALLEADVHFKVVKSFVEAVKQKALGQEVLKSVSPAEQFVKIVHDELVQVLGTENVEIQIKGNPPSIMMVGLQGSGKTTSSAKLALWIRKKLKKKPGLVPMDLYRPAAIEQLKVLGKNLDLPVFPTEMGQTLHQIYEAAKSWAQKEMVEVLILDTAGRSQIDASLMKEIADLKTLTGTQEVLLVADAMLGQQSVDVAQGFDQAVGLTGLVLTKIDGDARGGAALSIRQTTGVPIKFLGLGEKSDAFEVFHPDRLASRILDMGDIVTLVEKAQDVIDQTKAEESAKRLARNEFTVEDFLEQMKSMKKMGGLEGIMKLIPGMGGIMKQAQSMGPPDAEMRRIEAIISSMTLKERQNHKILNGSRRLRIAKGSGTQVSEVNKFIKQFEASQKMMSQLMKGGLKGMMGGGGMPPFGGGGGGGGPMIGGRGGRRGGGRGFPF
ncbi:MAG: signal recognition particle protein [Bdellovibrionales bacterium CG10_big_fil_rev_8_21_14_0_10_45_34]|nr:MAG: signal recognition particle protein [Bdellovibrionales bacterium CG10_big_fil_rev_8_21_14_0_10_45_34]